MSASGQPAKPWDHISEDKYLQKKNRTILEQRLAVVLREHRKDLSDGTIPFEIALEKLGQLVLSPSLPRNE